QEVAQECVATLQAHGFRPLLLADVGVAGVHRLLASVDELLDADAVIVIAGMEGALASLVGGITPAPVVAVPTSAGYGAGLDGVTALLAMLASCAAGITVVGIDNGFGAACAVLRLLRCRRPEAEARLPERVRLRAQRVFAVLAEVEGRLHRRPPEQVHFHEVGGTDAIIDVVGTCAALEILGVDDVRASAVATGRGMVRTSHGALP